MSARMAAAGAVAFLASCAAVPHRGCRGYEFPAAFDATQAVTVVLERGTLELLASVSRRERDFDVTLFDPVFAAPVLSASLRAAGPSEILHSEAMRPGDGKRLVELLASVYGARYSCPSAGSADAETRVLRCRLEQLPDVASCPFPATIGVAPRFANEPRVRVRTIEVSCGAPAPPPSR